MERNQKPAPSRIGTTLLQDHHPVYPTDGALPFGGRRTNQLMELVICLGVRKGTLRRKGGKLGPEFEGPVVGDAAQEITRGQHADETAVAVQNGHRMNPLIQHDAGDFTNVSLRGR